MIEALCVNDEPINSLHLPDLRRILNRLSSFFRSRRSRKRRRRTAQVNVASALPIAVARIETPRRLDRDREAWLAVQQRLRPDLDDRQLSAAYDVFVAVKERASFRDSKENTRH